MTRPAPNPTTVAEALAALLAVIAQQPDRNAPEVYDGSERDEFDGWSQRDLDALGDRRAGWHYPEGP